MRQRNGAPRMMDSSGSTHTYPLNLVPYEEALASVEDELDRQAATECRNELLAKRQRCNDNDDDDDQLIEERENQMNSVAEELETLDKQVRALITPVICITCHFQLQPIERYALRYIEAYRTEYHFTGVDSNTYVMPTMIADEALTHSRVSTSSRSTLNSFVKTGNGHARKQPWKKKRSKPMMI